MPHASSFDECWMEIAVQRTLNEGAERNGHNHEKMSSLMHIHGDMCYIFIIIHAKLIYLKILVYLYIRYYKYIQV